MKKSFFIETYGCEMNKAESAALAKALSEAGFAAAGQPQQADWAIINACSVRQTAEDRVWGRLGYYKALKARFPQLKVAVMGCMAERLRDELAGPPFFVDAVVGSGEKRQFAQKLAGFAPDSVQNSPFFDRYGDQGWRVYVPIMNGCDNFCSYCIVPYVRGREASRPVQEIVSECAYFIKQGAKEIVLLGQNVNSYNFSGVEFSELLRRVSQLPGDVWFKFTSSHPKDFNLQLLDALAADSRFASHLHLPVQHGSDRLLKSMNRKYTQRYYLDLLSEARRRLPDAAFSTDLMVGFPGETDEDFEILLDFTRKAQFADAFMYQYNDREGTAAYLYADKVADALKAKRLMRLIELQRSISNELLHKQLGKTVKVLVDRPAKKEQGKMLGRTSRNEAVVFAAKELAGGCFVHVSLKEVKGQTLLGEIV